MLYLNLSDGEITRPYTEGDNKEELVIPYWLFPRDTICSALLLSR